MSDVFVEDPWSRIVDVNWKKKDKPPDPPGGRPHMGPCGGYFWHADSLSAGFPKGMHVLESQYLCLMFNDITPGHNPYVPYAYANPFWHYFPHMDPQDYPYMWSSPRSYTVSHPGFSNGAGVHSPGRVGYDRNLNIQLILNAPFGVGVPVVGQSSPDGSIEIEGWRSNELYPPYVVVEVLLPGGVWVIYRNPGLEVRAHCDEESHEMPPQFEFWKGWNPPYPAPGDVRLPLVPPGYGDPPPDELLLSKSSDRKIRRFAQLPNERQELEMSRLVPEGPPSISRLVRGC